MTGKTRHARSIFATEALVQAMFNDFIPEGNGCLDGIANLQREFKMLILLARQQFESMKADLGRWRTAVSAGEVDFDSGREDDFKEALRGFISVADLLNQKFNDFHPRGVFLSLPRLVDLLMAHSNEAKKILNSWRSPEWEVCALRTVKWDKEQTKHLWARLAPCE